MINRLLASAAAALFLVSSASAHAASLTDESIRSAMRDVEAHLLRHGIDVKGYDATREPEVEIVPSRHIYLQGNDGGYVDGRIYLSEALIADCRGLALVHELVHDASVKYRLFPQVPNGDIRDMFEALADLVTADAAQEPYRPGCLPNRNFAIESADLAKLAMATPPS